MTERGASQFGPFTGGPLLKWDGKSGKRVEKLEKGTWAAEQSKRSPKYSAFEKIRYFLAQLDQFDSV